MDAVNGSYDGLDVGMGFSEVVVAVGDRTFVDVPASLSLAAKDSARSSEVLGFSGVGFRTSTQI